MQEFELYRQWQSLAGAESHLVNGGQRLKVLQSGELQTAGGPDFRSARFMLNGIIYQGDVECHVSTADWYRHHHHLDPAYRNVLLHVVAASDKHPQPVAHQLSAHHIPTISLPSGWQTFSASVCPAGEDATAQVRALGLERLRQKSFRLEHLLQTLSPERLFYELGLQVLGYGGNENGFRFLAERLPWSWFHRLVLRQPLHSVEAVCLGQAGLLSESTTYGTKLLTLFHPLQAGLEFNPLPKEIWRYSGIRPSNYPDFRLAGWAHLYNRRPSPFTALYNILTQRLPLNQLQTAINRFFYIPCSDFWQTHYTLNSAAHKHHTVYFGRARITEFLINLIIPLAYALARKNGSFGFIDYLESFYAQIRLPQSYRQIEKHFPSFANSRSALIAQGLLYAQQTYCSKGTCAQCPLLQKKH
jgi:hypothetical protein